MQDFFINIISGGIIGGFSSYVASKYFQKKNNEVNQPNLELSDQIIQAKRDDGTHAVELKLINHTDQDLSNIKLELEGWTNLAPQGSIPLFNLKELSTREILSIKKFDKNDKKNYHNAHRILLFNNNNIIDDIKNFKFVRISAFVSCPYYSTSAVISKNYQISTKLLDSSYSFNTGNSVDAHR